MERSKSAYSTTARMLLAVIAPGTPAAQVSRGQGERALSRHENPVTFNLEDNAGKSLVKPFTSQ